MAHMKMHAWSAPMPFGNQKAIHVKIYVHLISKQKANLHQPLPDHLFHNSLKGMTKSNGLKHLDLARNTVQINSAVDGF